MAKTPAFQAWVRRIAAEITTGKSIEERVEEEMAPEKLKVEVREGEKWVDARKA